MSTPRDRPGAAGEPTLTLSADGARVALDGWIVIATTEQDQIVRLVPPNGSLSIGRAAENELCIEHPSVSRAHARLSAGSPPMLQDLGSHNGTSVGGKRLGKGESAPLAPGALATVGAVPLLVQRIGADSGMLSAARPPAPKGARADAGSDHVVVCTGLLKQLVAVIERVANDSISVLLLGETGVGKDVFAELLHHRSVRARAPFVRLHCAAFSPSLIESELFGHERGAFTGADRPKAGLLEAAEGGTVFIDEVGELPMATQVKLLRVLEDRRVTRIGSTQARRIDVRFVAATNRDLEAEIATGTFRRDLYYRIAGLVLAIPPLRDRRDEIPALAEALLARAAEERGMAAPTIAADAMRVLQSHAWPGNVRELRNVLSRALVMGSGEPLGAEQLELDAAQPPRAAIPSEDSSGQTKKYPPEAQRILDALAQCGGNQTEAAKLVGVSRRTLITRMIDYGLPRPRKGSGGT